jgi:trans-aconitate methyltransferase
VTAPTAGGTPPTEDDWDSHWSSYGETAAANPAQSYRRRLLFDTLNLRPGDRLVDIGSGQGDLIRDATEVQPGIECVGLELGASGIEQARRKTPAARFVHTDLLEPQAPAPELARWGTVATCSEVLEHVDRPDVLLRNASAYLAPGAVVVVTVPAGPRSAFDRHIGHRRHFTRATLQRTLRDAGLEPVRMLAAGFPFFDLYRLAVLVRGRKVIDDAQDPAGVNSGASGSLMRAFDRLFRANLSNSPLGWQLIAVARVPRSADEPSASSGPLPQR